MQEESADAKVVYRRLRRAVDSIGRVLGEDAELEGGRPFAPEDLTEAVDAARGAAGDLGLLIALLFEKAASEGLDVTADSYRGLVD